MQKKKKRISCWKGNWKREKSDAKKREDWHMKIYCEKIKS